ncbi:MAG: response regulator transcription factor [Anaerolineae bacterium]
MNKTRVLLADDHAVVRAGIRDALQDLPNLEVIGEVGDGLALVQALEELQPDCLLIDVTMPQFEPIATIRRIRAHYPQLRILVVSAYDDDVYVKGMLSAGVDGYHL